MSRLLLKRPSPFAFPGGQPGFDPSHPASPNLRFSAVSRGANFINVLTGAPCLTAGSPTANLLDIGPSTIFSGASDAIQFFSSGLASPSALTIAAIFQCSTLSGSDQIIFSNDNAATEAIFYVQGANNNLSIYTGSSYSSGLVVAAHVPYFAVYSLYNNVGTFLLMRLDTGAVVSSTVSTATPSLSDGYYDIGNDGFSSPLKGGVSAIMYSAKNLSMPQILQWAQDPWAFWYPRKFDLWAMLKAASGGGTPYSLTAASGTYTYTGSLTHQLISLLASAATYLFTGAASTKKVGLGAAAATYSLTGAASTRAMTFLASVGTYLLTGAASTKAVLLGAASAAYSLTGAASTRAMTFLASVGTYLLTGAAATLTWVPFGNFVLTAAAGAYAFSGQVAHQLISRVSGVGTYALTGAASTKGVLMGGVSGAYTYTGQVTTRALKKLTAAGAYAFSGAAAGLTWVKFGSGTAYTLVAAFGVYTYTGLVSIMGHALPYVKSGKLQPMLTLR